MKINYDEKKTRQEDSMDKNFIVSRSMKMVEQNLKALVSIMMCGNAKGHLFPQMIALKLLHLSRVEQKCDRLGVSTKI